MMHSETQVHLTLHETCHALGLEQHYLIEIVETGMVEPIAERDSGPEDWLFDAGMLALLRRASRLSEELHLDYSATAILVELLEERDQLQRENARLRRQLQRFLHEQE